MEQLSFSDLETSLRRKTRKTRTERLTERLEKLVPWSDLLYLDYRCKNPMDAGCPSGSTSSRRFPGGLIFLEAR